MPDGARALPCTRGCSGHNPGGMGPKQQQYLAVGSGTGHQRGMGSVSAVKQKSCMLVAVGMLFLASSSMSLHRPFPHRIEVTTMHLGKLRHTETSEMHSCY